MGSADPGPSGEPAFDTDELLRFPLAAQPEIMRAAEKDDQYASFVYDACRDAFRHLFGTRLAVAYQNETKLLGQMLYYVLTTGSGQQTLGEEYCDITQVAGPYRLSPTPAKRALFIVYQTAVPYIAERIRCLAFLYFSKHLDISFICNYLVDSRLVDLDGNSRPFRKFAFHSSRVASHGILLAESHSGEFYSDNAPVWSSHVQSPTIIDMPSSSASTASVSALEALKEKLKTLWLSAVRSWPAVLPFARELLQLVLRANLMFFYFEGLYYHLSKRASGIRYVFIGKPSNQRPRYQILGIFLLIQLCIIAAEGLRRSNLSSIATSVHYASLGSNQTSAGWQF